MYTAASALPVKALHADKEPLTGWGEVSTPVPVEAINVGDIGAGQLLGELCCAAGETPPLEAGLVGWALWLRAGQLLVQVASETLSYRFVQCKCIIVYSCTFLHKIFLLPCIALLCLALHCHKHGPQCFFFLL